MVCSWQWGLATSTILKILNSILGPRHCLSLTVGIMGMITVQKGSIAKAKGMILTKTMAPTKRVKRVTSTIRATMPRRSTRTLQNSLQKRCSLKNREEVFASPNPVKEFLDDESVGEVDEKGADQGDNEKGLG